MKVKGVDLAFFVFQIWTLLPSFCNHATDVVLSFKGLARILGTAINDCSELRQIVCQALRRLINKGCQTGKYDLLIAILATSSPHFRFVPRLRK